MFVLVVVRVVILAFIVNNSVATIVKEDYDDSKINVVSWHAPFLSSSSGYGSEASSFLVGLNNTLDKKRWILAAGLSHGDSVDYRRLSSLPRGLHLVLSASEYSHHRYVLGVPLQQQEGFVPGPAVTSAAIDAVVIICHSEPGAWSTKDGPHYESPIPCPPDPIYRLLDGSKRVTYVGRTMFETDRLPTGWSDRMNELMDEVWVPTKHHQRIFQRDGVTSPELVVVGQGIDVSYWDPERVQPLDWEDITYLGWYRYNSCSEHDYLFLSVFKWEKRKAPDVLLPSFWKAFPRGGACLIIVTSLYHDNEDRIIDEIEKHWKESKNNNDSEEGGGKEENAHATASSPRGIILMNGLQSDELMQLYRTVDAFVLPSRGEGWGRPYMEAMAMALPVIATNWSGPTEFVTDDVGYLLPIEGLVDAGLDAFPHHKWAEPSQKELRQLLRSISGQNRTEAKIKGIAARQHIVQNWSSEVVAKQVADHLDRIALKAEAIKGDPSIAVHDNNDEL